MNTFARAALAATLLTPGSAWAEASNFNYVEARYLQGDVDDFDVDGWGVEGSVELTRRVFLEAFYGDLRLDEDVPGFDADLEAAGFGAGYVFGENETGNFYGTLGYIAAENRIDTPLGDLADDEDGYTLGLGTRFNLGPQAELRFEVDYIEIGGDDTVETSAALVYSFTPRFAGVAEYSRDSDTSGVGLGVRFYFR